MAINGDETAVTVPGAALLIAAAPVGKGRLMDPATVLPALAAVPPRVLTGTPGASVVELVDPADPQVVLTRLRTAAAFPGPLLIHLIGQLTLDRKQQLPHLALARTTATTVRYTGFPWHWLAAELQHRPAGSTTLLADLVADTAAWSRLRAFPDALRADGVRLFGTVAPPPERRSVAAPEYSRAVSEILRPAASRPPLEDLHRRAAAMAGLLDGTHLMLGEDGGAGAYGAAGSFPAPTAATAPPSAPGTAFSVAHGPGPASGYAAAPGSTNGTEATGGAGTGAYLQGGGTDGAAGSNPGVNGRSPNGQSVSGQGVSGESLSSQGASGQAPDGRGGAQGRGTDGHGAAYASSAPAQPVPAQPVPAQPLPAQPVPTQPVPAQPAPTQPAPYGGTSAPRQPQHTGAHPSAASAAHTTAAPAPAAPAYPRAGSGAASPGTGVPVQAPAPVQHPPRPAADPDPHPAILAAAREGRHGEAAAMAAAWEQQALRLYGAASAEAVHWLEVRADLARLAGDFVRSCELWTAAASARMQRGEPPEAADVVAAVDRAHHCWEQVADPAAARGLAHHLLEMRRAVPGPRPGAVQALERRVESLDGVAAG
ncbi:hypothetical protein ABT112_22900 [Streptomyces sp. NPDC002055]|uniref:hypothetical protein n=1 Tax=Streptomyces sp. NPDC002055 TaxID=3154534 RepID=UPI00331F1FB7